MYNILEGTAEAENVLFRDDDAETGFVLTPDLCVPPLRLFLTPLTQFILDLERHIQQMGSKNPLSALPPRPSPGPFPPFSA